MGFFPFADPSHKLRASAQGQNDNIRRRFFADAQNDKREAQNDMGNAQNDKREAQNDMRDAQNDKIKTQNDRKGEAE
jgi:hypothetical protein